MATNDKKNAFNFYISICDLIIELFYKVTTNFRTLGKTGRYFSDIRVELVWTLLAHSVQKVNSYWSQYFQPSSGTGFNLKAYIGTYQYYLFIPFILYVIGCKLLVDYRHMQATVVLYLLTKVPEGLFLIVFCNLYMISGLLDSLFNCVIDWYVNITGKKIAGSVQVPLSKPVKFKLDDFVSTIRTFFNNINNIFECIYTIFILYYDWPRWLLCTIAPVYIMSNFMSSFIKAQVNIAQSSTRSATPNNAGETNSYMKMPIYTECGVLLLYIVMVFSPFIQFSVIVMNVALFFGCSTSSIGANLIALTICLTFVLHKLINKGDQVFKYIYGLDYSCKKYTMLNCYDVDNSNTKNASSFELTRDLMSALDDKDEGDDYDWPPSAENSLMLSGS